jgi:hypothetical protein
MTNPIDSEGHEPFHQRIVRYMPNGEPLWFTRDLSSEPVTPRRFSVVAEYGTPGFPSHGFLVLGLESSDAYSLAEFEQAVDEAIANADEAQRAHFMKFS